MKENLLQFIWRFQYFNKQQLITTDLLPIEIITPGTLNTHQGPDFSNAKIRIGNTLWAGSIELHTKTSEWDKHHHSRDPNYKSVILHVVYEHDVSHSHIPVLELKGRVANSLQQRYQQLMLSAQFIPCQTLITNVPELTVSLWKERLVAERLQRKTTTINQYQQQNHQHWEETFWWLLAKNFGTKTNSHAFEAIAQSIPLSTLAKHKYQLIQLEALLMGQAGLLNTNNFSDKYGLLLQKEYQFLKAKHQLSPIAHSVHFLRMRPGNFPTIRLAQMAALIYHSTHLFSKIVAEPSLQKIKQWFNTTPNDFWSYHYTLQDTAALKPKPIGADMIHNIIINTIVPTLFAYGAAHQNQSLKDKALQWLEQTQAEQNTITKKFKTLHISLKTAWDSQALIELKTQYCHFKKCLDCAIGNAIIKN